MILKIAIIIFLIGLKLFIILIAQGYKTAGVNVLKETFKVTISTNKDRVLKGLPAIGFFILKWPQNIWFVFNKEFKVSKKKWNWQK